MNFVHSSGYTSKRKQRWQKMLDIIRMLEQDNGLLTKFEDGLWNATVETVTVQDDGRMVFRWRNGAETQVYI